METTTRKTTLDAILREDVRQQQEAEKAAKKNTFKPMLAATCEDITKIKYPVLVSPKLDGIRCVIRNGAAYSRNLKLIPNDYIQHKLKGLPDGLDGELIVGPATGEDVWNRSQSGVMRKEGEPAFTFYVFDCAYPVTWPVAVGFQDRLQLADESTEDHSDFVKMVTHTVAMNADDLSNLEAHAVEHGYEGVMIRDPNGKYKCGRSTVKEGGLLKLKRWHDAEAVVVGLVERMHNGNEATTDALGRTKRASIKANKSGRGDLGALVCKVDELSLRMVPPGEPTKDIKFELGTGFTDAQRIALWEEKDVLGKTVTFKYQSLSPDGVPRFPVFKGFRDERDI